MKVLAIRIVPFDLGFEIDNKGIGKIKKVVKNDLNNELHFNEVNSKALSYNYYININTQLKMVFFNDGTGQFIFLDKVNSYGNLSSENLKKILKKRTSIHKQILAHSHPMSIVMDEYLSKIRNVEEKKRRFTSKFDWESGGLSYVMSFYFIEGNLLSFSPEEKNNLLNLLFTSANYKKTRSYKETDEEIKKHFKLLNNNVEFASSWANFIVVSNNIEEYIEEYVNVEINIQHIWMYTYIIDKLIDSMIACVKENDAKVSYINIAYNNLLNMEVYINKYKGIISSIMHERDYIIYNSLIESSKLNILINNVLHKYELLDNRLKWLIDEKRYKSGKRVEVFVFLCTFLSAFSIVKDFKLNYLCEYWYFFATVLGLTYILFFHKRK